MVDLAFFQKKDYVTANDMKSYAQAFASYYNQDISSFNQTERIRLYLYSPNGYNVTSYISSSYGAAILFVPSQNWNFENNNMKQRVETVFGGNEPFPIPIPPNSSKFIVGGKDTTIHTNNGFIELGDKSSVFIEKISVNSTLYPLIILKWSNDSSNWNIG